MPKIGFNTLTQGQVAGNVQSAEVRGPGGNNASPFMMKREVVGKAFAEATRFANVYRIPFAVRRNLAGDIDTGTIKVDRSDGMQLEVIDPTASATALDDWRRIGVRLKCE